MKFLLVAINFFYIRCYWFCCFQPRIHALVIRVKMVGSVHQPSLVPSRIVLSLHVDVMDAGSVLCAHKVNFTNLDSFNLYIFNQTHDIK